MMAGNFLSSCLRVSESEKELETKEKAPPGYQSFALGVLTSVVASLHSFLSSDENRMDVSVSRDLSDSVFRGWGKKLNEKNNAEKVFPLFFARASSALRRHCSESNHRTGRNGYTLCMYMHFFLLPTPSAVERSL